MSNFNEFNKSKDYYKIASKITRIVRDEAIMRNLSEEETLELARSVAKKEFAAKNKKDTTLKWIKTHRKEQFPLIISGTNIKCSDDDLHYVNNAAVQQMWDDIRRTCIVGLDLAHEIMEKRLGKEITPETINYYLEILNHAMPGAAIVQEHMVEVHPAMVDDCYVKVFTGDELLQDELDPQFLINIDNIFNPIHAAQIRASIGRATFQAVHVPTVISRVADGGQTSRWMAMQIGMSFIGAYHCCAGEAATADLAFSAKHAGLVEMGEMLPARRGRSPNEPGGLSFGHMADIVQTSRKTSDDPCRVVLQVASAASVLYDQIWFGGYMSGGGTTLYATPTYTNDILDDDLYATTEYGWDTYDANVGNTISPTIDVIKDIGTWGTLYGLEQYESYPTALEDHFDGSQRATVIATSSASPCAICTGNSNAGLSAWYLSMGLQKEAWGRLGGLGYDSQDQCGAANVFSIGSDEGCIGELRGPNYPNYAMNVGHLGGYTAIVSSAHAGRSDAFCVNPLVKVCFADDLINFDFTNPRREFAEASVRNWDRCAGERAFIIKAK